MRIGIDGRALTGRYTGDRTYWLNIIRSILNLSKENPREKDEYFVYSRLPIPSGILPDVPNLNIRVVPANNDRIWTIFTFPKALKMDGMDIGHTQYTIPIRPPCPIITTIHDISFRLYPEWFPRKHRLLLNLSVPPAMRRAKKVITVSESSRRDIIRIYGLEESKIIAIPEAAGPEYGPVPKDLAREAVKDRFGITDPFLITVGVLQPRKNHSMLIEAFARARRQSGIPHKLVITGKKGWEWEALIRQAARLNVADALIYTDYVEDENLPPLYSTADGMAFPSLYEGFGLPPLEAMACGTPTLVSDAPAMPEVVGDGAWVLPKMDAVAWGDAIVRILTDAEMRQYWSERGLRRAEQFSWVRSAKQTLDVYREVAGVSVPG
jgi:glycosyltransferase involved in cell wall biosynthesis